MYHILMKEFSINCFEIREIFLVAIMPVSSKKLKKHILSVDEILSVYIGVFFVVEFAQLVEIVEYKFDEMTNIVERSIGNLRI